jgi:hypothetical protein
MNFKKELLGVAEAAAKIMNEQLKGKQHKIDKNKNNKIDSEDFEILRGEKKAPMKIDELSTDLLSRYKSAAGQQASSANKSGNVKLGDKRFSGIMKATRKQFDNDSKKHPVKEEIKQIDEYKSVDGVYKHKGTYGTEKSTEAGYTDYDKENKMAKKITDSKAKQSKKYGARQNYIRSTRVNESFTELLEAYKQNGLSVFVKEEPDNEQYHKEVDDQIATATGKKKQPKLSTGETVGVKSMAEETHTEVEVYDFTDVHGVKVYTIDLKERSLTEPEAKKKEEIVKSMKKKMPDFKERYGERAKEVMYATATKQAMKG